MYSTGAVTSRSIVTTGQPRVLEYLESLKGEFDSLAHDVNMYKMQRDDYERKLQSQLVELSNIQQTLYDLERNHSKIKQQYEEEILRLRRQLELTQQSSNSSGFVGNSSSTRPVISPLEKGTLGGMINSNGPSTSNPNSVNSNSNLVFYNSLAPIDKRNDLRTPLANPSPSVTNKRPRGDENFTQVGQGSVDTTSKQQKSDAPENQPSSNQLDLLTSEDKNKQGDKKEKSSLDVSKDDPLGSAKDKKSTDESGGVDWIVGFNPGVSSNLNIDLLHSLEHSSVVCCVKFSNDGKCVATGCNKSAQIYDVETGEKIHTFSDENAKDGDLYIRSVCFSPDNKYLAAGAEDKTVKVWDIEQNRLKHVFTGHELDIYSLDFSKDGNLIVSGSGDKKAKIWDVEKAECLFTLGNEEVGPKDGVTSVAFSPDGRLVAAGSLDRIVRVWDAQTGYFLERYEGHLDSVYSVAFSPDGKSLASGSLDKTLKLWDLSGSRSRSRCRSTFTGHKDFVLSVAFSADGNWLISGSKDRSVQFWDPRNAVTHMMLQGHKNSVISVAVSPAGGVFATGSGDFRARVWRYE